MLKHLKQSKQLNKLITRAVFSKPIEPTPIFTPRQQPYQFSTTSSAENFNKEWTKILANAEKVVGYPTSFLNLRYLVSDEVANFANLLRKLIKTKHPLIKMARSMISSSASENDSGDRRSALQFNGLILLLISKAAGVPPLRPDSSDDSISDGIHRLQRSLAEISEMIYMGSLIHKGIVDPSNYDGAEYTSMDQGNKIAVLCGDYLLANACRNLSKLQNTEVVALMSQVIADISQSIFIHGSLNINAKLSLVKLWYESANSDSSSLLANSARASLLLVKHSPQLQEAASIFARNLDLAYKIWSDLMDFKKDCHSVINKNEAIIYAIYKDKYEREDEEENKVRKAAVVSTSIRKKPPSVLSSYSSFFSTFYPSFAVAKSTDANPQLIDDVLYDRILTDCRDLFSNHYRLAIDSLNSLENEHSERDAVASLRSMLNVMNSTV